MTKIYVMTHKRFVPPEIEGYVPLHVGRKLGGDLGYIGDDTGDSISQYNCYFGELTGMYWIWKNVSESCNVGICHYRRYFTNASGEYLKPEEFDELLKSYDIVTSKEFGVHHGSYRADYAAAHTVEDLDMTGEVIKELYPEYYGVFCDVINGSTQYMGNLMCTSKSRYDEYCEWLFTIFDKLYEKIDFDKYEDDYHRRVFGFLSEQLLMVWVLANKLKVYECTVYITDEKAETKEFKTAIRQLIKMNNIGEAYSLFYEVLKVRPDIALTQSDLRGEVRDIELVLRILKSENEQNVRGLLNYSDDLYKLLEHVAKIREIVQKSGIKSNNACRLLETDEYLKANSVSLISLKIISDAGNNRRGS